MRKVEYGEAYISTRDDKPSILSITNQNMKKVSGIHQEPLGAMYSWQNEIMNMNPKWIRE